MQYDVEAPARLQERFADSIVRVVAAAEDSMSEPFVEVIPDAWADIAAVLRDDEAFRFDYLNDLCVVDYCANEKKTAKAVGDERLEVVYHLSSVSRKRQLTVKATLSRWADADAQTPPGLPSVAHLWATAEWHECEAYDLSGVEFIGHPNLRRILCPEDWVGHPLRKDYQMPLEYHGIRGR